MKHFVAGGAIALAIALSFWLGYKTCQICRIPPPQGNAKVDSSIIYHRDTLKAAKPLFLSRIELSPVLLPVYFPADTIRDTIFVPVPVEQRHYAGEGYEAWISGFRPELDSIHVFRDNKVVTVTKHVPVPAAAKRWGAGVQAGVTVTPEGVKPYLGAGISYHFLQW